MNKVSTVLNLKFDNKKSITDVKKNNSQRLF